MEPIFLHLDEVIEIHQDQIKQYGGSPGIRDKNLLLSALAVPCSTFDGNYLHENIFEMAAAYLFHIVKNHPFIDGNKRVGLVSGLVFLLLNDINIEVEEDALEKLVLDVAIGKTEKTAISKFLKNHSSKLTA